MIVWLTGNSGSGKTAIGKLVANKLGAILLDGDRMRETISLGAGFSKDDREEHNLRVARLARELHSQWFHVVVTVIAPFESTRRKIDKMISPIWVRLFRPSLAVYLDRPYEKPTNAFVSVDTDEMDISQCLDAIMGRIT